MSLPNYPDALPPEAVQMTVAALRGQLPPLATGIHAVYTVLGFGLSQAFPDPAPTSATAQPPISRVTKAPLSKEQVANHLEKLTAPHDHAAMRALNLPWGQIIAALLALAQQLMASQAGV